MASIPYCVLSPSGILCAIGLLHGPDKTVPNPSKDYRNETVDLVIPAFNEEKNIVLCLESIARQTVKPNNIIIVDDGSTDRTSEFARGFAESIGLNAKTIRREKSEGKTPTVREAAHKSTADVLFVMDADTTLRSENYIARLRKELFQGAGIACACGIILPEFERDRMVLMNTEAVTQFAEKYPDVKKPIDNTWLQRVSHNITSNYREELYLFLQKFIYHGEMVFFGSIINPIGCAVAYRRKYLIDILDYYTKTLGDNLTTSEDIFIGFAFADMGYRNIQVQDVYALTLEPSIDRLPRQIAMWSSSYLQSCYYFNRLVATPFKSPSAFFRYLKGSLNSKVQKEVEEKRIYKEAYRQSFGTMLTLKYGRPIGWFVFTSLFEKISFPTIMIIFIILRLWEALLLTVLAEVVLYTVLIGFMHKNRRLRNILKSICFTPIRYAILLFDVLVVFNFAKDVWFTKNRNWKK